MPKPKNPSQVNLRVEVTLRKAFQQVAKKNDLTASQAIRSLMRDYVAKHGAERPAAGPK